MKRVHNIINSTSFVGS